MPFVPAEARGTSPDTCYTWQEGEQGGSKPSLLFWHLRSCRAHPWYLPAPLMSCVPFRDPSPAATRDQAGGFGNSTWRSSGPRRSRDRTAASAAASALAGIIPLRSEIRVMGSSGRRGRGQEDARGDSVTRSLLRVSVLQVNAGKQLLPSLPLASKPKK